MEHYHTNTNVCISIESTSVLKSQTSSQHSNILASLITSVTSIINYSLAWHVVRLTPVPTYQCAAILLDHFRGISTCLEVYHSYHLLVIKIHTAVWRIPSFGPVSADMDLWELNLAFDHSHYYTAGYNRTSFPFPSNFRLFSSFVVALHNSK